MTRPPDRTRSLDELEGAWPAPLPGATRLVTAVHAARRRPVGDLSVEELRVLIGQNVGLPYVLPLAVAVLRDDPTAEGDLYPGDLLSAVVTRHPAVWAAFPDLRHTLRLALASPTAPLPALPPALRAGVDEFLTPRHL
ncbi:contact-dependent growth inhibition system immunity protein [Kitasatospora sp. NBC_01539]|uniref:contact-dependent growth inhibition system immunity protein n=1 Tax=Kitasatospora sp. NBC_01539 TaxID=2903577 RepID=UPI0038600A3C